MVSKEEFDYARARRAVDLWVDNLNNEFVNWAWDVVIGVVEVYANTSVEKDQKYSEALAGIYFDFFDAWHEGAANLGIIGMVQELQAACPPEHAADLDRIMRLAYEAGKTGVSVPKKQTYCFTKTDGDKYRPVVKPPEAKVPTVAPVGIRLLIDNTKEAK